MQVLVLIAIIILCITCSSEAWALTDQSQKVLNNYQNYEHYGSAPATSQPYTPDTSSAVNAVPIQKTNVQVPTSTPPPTQPTTTNVTPNPQSWIVLLVILLVIAAGAGTYKKVGGPWGSYTNPPSMKQLAWLRNRGYRGPMPSSSRDAHYIIQDIQRGGDGNYQRDKYR